MIQPMKFGSGSEESRDMKLHPMSYNKTTFLQLFQMICWPLVGYEVFANQSNNKQRVLMPGITQG